MRLSMFFIFLCICTLAKAVETPDPMRILRTFDFEERRLGNVEDLPMEWAKVEGAGLPHYVTGHLTTDRHRSGEYSFEFDLDGGSLTYRYPPGHIPVQTGAHYEVQTYVQTSTLPNARARLTAYLADADGHAILGSIRESELFATPPGDLSWHRLGVELNASDATARFVVLELSLLQPQLYAQALLGKRTVFDQDIHGSAWFDDVTVSQVPLVALSTDHPGNVFRRSDPMRLHVYVNDKFTDDLSARLLLRDAVGNTVYQNTGAVDLAGAETLGPEQKRMTLMLPNTLGAGWYQASLEMSSRGKPVGRQHLNLVRLADDSTQTVPDERFGVNATELPFAAWSALPDLLPYLGAGRVKLAVWSKRGDVDAGDIPASASTEPASMSVRSAVSEQFDRLLEQFQQMQIKATACLVDLPPKLSARLKGSTWTALLDNDRALWQPSLAFLIARNANHLTQWQLGDDSSDAFVQDPRMRDVYAAVRKEFAALVEKPDLAMPWPAWYELTGDAPASVALHVRPQVIPSQIPLYVDDIRSSARAAGTGSHGLSLYLEPLERKAFGRDVQIRDFAQRFAYATSVDAQRIDIRLPFSAQKVGDQWMSQPDELLLIARTLMTTLGGATFRGKMPIAEGIDAFLYEKNEQGIILLWDRAERDGTKAGGPADGALKQLALNLGRRPMSMDLWGNVTPLLQASQADSGAEQSGVAVQVGPMPTFLIDIDPYLAQLRASFGVDDARIESTFQSHTRHVHFTNPYRQSISGMVRLRAPQGWTLNPATFSYSLNPGEMLDKPIAIDFPLNSPAGEKTINAAITVQSLRTDQINVPITLELGLSDMGMQTLALRDGNDVIVQQMISNYGEKPINYNAFALCAGKARQERLVISLAPGAKTVKKYRFVGVTDVNAKIRSGIKEVGGNRVLNNEVAIQ